MNIIENLKEYFNKKKSSDSVSVAPEGICPNCWGRLEWEGEYFKFMKGENGNPSNETYNNFILNVSRQLDKITIIKNTYSCETCKMKNS